MKTFLCLMAILAAALTARAQGSLEAMQGYVNPSSNVYSVIGANFPITLGWTFQPQTDINVTALGAFSYVLQNPGNLEIGLWDSGGNLLASNAVSITGTSAATVYSSIAPLMLMAGQTYYLSAYSPSQTVYFYVVGPNSDTYGYAIMSPEIQLGGLAFNTNRVFAFPSSIEGQPGDAVVMPNFQFEAVPEPSIFSLLGGGIIAFLTMRKKIKSPAVGA
jgi:hypothetical protein